MKPVLIVVVLALVAAACGKDKYETKPTVQIESFGPEIVEFGDVMQLRATVTDAEGDLQDSVIFVRNRYEGDVRISSDSSFGTNLQRLNVPNRRKVELEFTLPYGREFGNIQQFQNTERGRDRELAISVIVYDKAGNISEGTESNKVLLKKQ
jgi:hypothetical protein